ncbi:MAG: hypothetical protein LUD17_02315 [Bacteroidales bacterium]|nr:hypothetical protein [Bacteroidales bacterium]
MKYNFIATLALAGVAFVSKAETVAFSENFDSDWTESFPTVIDTYGGLPAYSIQALFLGVNGYYEAWWHLKDSSSSTDRYLASHSYYTEPAQSGSYLCSRAIEIPTEGFVLTFGAQSYEVGRAEDGEKLSDLWVFISTAEPTKDNLPTEEVLHVTEAPIGRSAADLASDFTEYSLSLDQWAGQTIYLTFANLNEDKDILAIDNIKIARADCIELTVDEPAAMSAEESFTVTATLTATEDVTTWAIAFSDGQNAVAYTGENLKEGESVSYDFTSQIEVGETRTYQVVASADNQTAVTASGTVSRMSFEPFRKVLVEEITGTWCGNCPLGSYNVESMLEDEEMGQYVVPVAVHIAGTSTDPMVCSEYANALGVSAAPMFRLNREDRYIGLGVHDYTFNPDDELSLAYQVRLKHEELTFLDIELDGEYDEAENAFDMVATVTSALPIENNRYSIGWVLTENNVTLDHRQWYQTNYFSGEEIDGDLGGWTSMPEHATGVYWHDVARGVWDIVGAEGTLPTTLDFDTPYLVSKTLVIPDTETVSSNGNVTAPAVRPEYCTVIAYVVDMDEMEIMNVAWMPMSDVAQDRITIHDLLGVTSVDADAIDGPVTYYRLDGIQLPTAPASGLYIERRGTTSRLRLN